MHKHYWEKTNIYDKENENIAPAFTVIFHDHKTGPHNEEKGKTCKRIRGVQTLDPRGDGTGKILLRVLLQKIIIAEKSMGGTLSYKKFKLARAMVPEHFLPAYSPMLHLMKKKNTWWSSENITNIQVKIDRQCTPLDRYSIKICEKLTHCAGAEDICGTIDCFWRTHIWYTPVHPIKFVHPWKILVHPRVYDTPGWQALSYRAKVDYVMTPAGQKG